MKMEKAPILITVYNRKDHFIKCIESLKMNTLANESSLVVAIDSPFRDEDVEANRAIIDYSKTIVGFKDVALIIRKSNIGAFKNLKLAIEEIFLRSDRLIFFEDDNVFSSDFLFFVNKGLEVFKCRKDIFSISGYHYPINFPKTYGNNIYLWTGFSAWGAGIWKEKWENLNINKEIALSLIKENLRNYRTVLSLNRIANIYIPALLNMVEQNSIQIDGYVSMYQFIQKMYTVFPTISRVRNTGHDGSGINCEKIGDDIYSEQRLYSESDPYELNFNIKPDKKIHQILRRHFMQSAKSQLRTASKLLQTNFDLPNTVTS